MHTEEKRELVRAIYDMRSGRNDFRGGRYEGDFHGGVKALREAAPVHEGTVASNLGLPYHDYLVGWDDNHYSCFSWEACNAAFRDNETFSSNVYSLGEVASAKFKGSILEMTGEPHKRYRALVHPNFVKKTTSWWIDRFIGGATDRLIDEFASDGSADLNLQLSALLPLYTITGSLGIEEDEALTFSDLVNKMNQAHPPPAQAAQQIEDLLRPLVEERRLSPQDDLLSVLAQAKLVDEAGEHSLDDDEIMGFSRLLITAGLSTTWRQLGILLFLILRDRAVLDAVRHDDAVLYNAIEEMLRWEGTEVLMRRHVTRDTTLEGFDLPKGSVLEICMAAANRDPARWDDPDEYDIHRPRKPHLAFGGGPHVCLGMHVARAEMVVAVQRVLERLPNLRIDPDAEPPRFLGFEGRAVTALPVVWDA
jgi:cytochrome P450